MKIRTIIAAAATGILLTVVGSNLTWDADWTCLRGYADCTDYGYYRSHEHGDCEDHWSEDEDWVCPDRDHGWTSPLGLSGYGCHSGDSHHGRRDCGSHHRQGRQYCTQQYRTCRTATRQESDIKQTIGQYADMVKHICFVYMKNESDTEDVFQDVFLKYALFFEPLDSKEHKKAQLIRVTVDECKDLLRNFLWTYICSLEETAFVAGTKSQDLSHVLESMMNLSDKYRTIVYLHCYEGYSAVEIASILHKDVNTVCTHLSRAKVEPKKMLGGDEGGTKYT